MNWLKNFIIYTGHILLFGLLLSCSSSRPSRSDNIAQPMLKSDPFLENLLKQSPQYFDHILKYKDSFRVQIIYTQINRTKGNKPVFKTYYFNVNTRQYFYPASTVKMPVALLSLQWLKELRNDQVDLSTTMITEKGNSIQTEVFNDPTSSDGRPTIGHYIKKIFLVSDNDAFNRLYELLGPEYINQRLRKMGFRQTEIIHRLSIPLSEQQNRASNPVRFLDTSMKPLYSKAYHLSTLPLLKRNDFLGKGYISEGKLVSQQFNFSQKNRVTLEDLNGMIRSILFPSSVRISKRFDIAEEDYRFVWKYMSQYPSETSWPPYDTTEYWDAYCKFLYWGSEKETLPKHLRIFNKVGDAYGFLTDAAYIVDFEKNIEFMLAATIYCNRDGIFNDDKYEYEEIGFPFMKNLGRVIYQYESEREKKIKPDLSEFKMNYDK